MNTEEPEISRILKSDRINLWLTLVSYILLIFVTLFVGFDIYKGIRFRGRCILSKETSNKIATISLVVIWCIFLIITSMRLEEFYNPK